MKRITETPRHGAGWIWAAICAVALLTIAPAFAQDSSDVAKGAERLDEINDGTRGCRELSGADFEAVGEFTMERMLGSARAHEGMDRMMDSTMGDDGLEQMHRFMGRRLAGCGGTAPARIGGMMGMLGMMGGGAGPGMMGGGAGMMGGDEDSAGPGGYGPGMMDPAGDREDDGDDEIGAGGVAAVGLIMLALLGAFAYLLDTVVRGRRPARGSGEALAILDRRLALGEIGREDYDARRAALGGP